MGKGSDSWGSLKIPLNFVAFAAAHVLGLVLLGHLGKVWI